MCMQVAVHCMTMDMQDLPAVAKTLAQLPAEFKPIDILINNAGLALGLCPADEVKIEVRHQLLHFFLHNPLSAMPIISLPQLAL